GRSSRTCLPASPVVGFMMPARPAIPVPPEKPFHRCPHLADLIRCASRHPGRRHGARVTHPSPQTNPLCLVIADDEAPIRMVVGEKLRSAGFIVHEARDGEEALELVRVHLPVALVTDLQMPCMNGLELCLALRASP